MTESSNLNAKISVLNNLNSIINANKKRYESLKFNLITDRQVRQGYANDNEFELKLPCWIVQREFLYNYDKRFRYRFIRRLISLNKSYFINSFEHLNRMIPNDIETFASNIIHDIINNEKGLQKVVNTFAESLVEDLFKELKLQDHNSFKVDLPDLVIDKPSRNNSEDEDTLDDMSSLNSSMGSHCRQLFVHNFLVKRRHSADVIGMRPIIHKKVNYESKLHLPINLTRCRSLTSFGLSNHFNKEITDLERLNCTSSQSTQINSQIKKQSSKRSRAIRKYLKELLINLQATRKLSLISKRPRMKVNQSPNQIFAINLVDELWNESMMIIKSISEQVECDYANELAENVLKDAFEDMLIINNKIKKSDRFYFKCECTRDKKMPTTSSSSQNELGNNINCLLTVYCMMIALAELELSQITFICCHFDS